MVSTLATRQGTSICRSQRHLCILIVYGLMVRRSVLGRAVGDVRPEAMMMAREYFQDVREITIVFSKRHVADDVAHVVLLVRISRRSASDNTGSCSAGQAERA